MTTPPSAVVTAEQVRALVDRLTVSLGSPSSALGIDGSVDALPAALPVTLAGAACIGTALSAAQSLARHPSPSSPGPGGHSVSGASLDLGSVPAVLRSEAHLSLAGEPVAGGFAPLSRFFETSDGWVRTHANYPWHRSALLAALDVVERSSASEAATTADVESAFRRRVSAQVCADIDEAGGIAVPVFTPAEWAQHPQGVAAAATPLIDWTLIAGSPARTNTDRRAASAPGRPLAGLRVLDLTRVIAGPVATRYLAALGADVLRLDPPHRPELALHRLDGLAGKRSALLDARTGEGLQRLHELLDEADVLVHGYRPGALAAFGLDHAALAERHAGLVSVSLSAWGSTGPWRQRRGFDSIVQAASGIAMLESPDGTRPGALPVQLLDHGTGYLMAAAACEGVRRQRHDGGTPAAALSLAATAHWLRGLAGETGTSIEAPTMPVSSVPTMAVSSVPTSARPGTELGGADTLELHSEGGPVTMVRPPGSMDGVRLSWPPRLAIYGADEARWRLER